MINIYNIGPVIYLFRMKRFTRKNSQNQSSEQLGHRRIRTELDDQDLSRSSSTAKNLSLDEVSIERNINPNNSAASLIFNLLRNKIHDNLRHWIYKLKNNTKLAKTKDKSVSRIICITSKRLYKLKLESFNKIKQQKSRNFVKAKAANIFNTCSSGVVRKLMMEGYFGIFQFSQLGLTKENNKLKQTEKRYNQISIPEDHCLSFRKFLKISPKNPKPFLKITQQSIQPTLAALSSLLKQKRIQKNILSQSELLVSSIINYICLLKDFNEKLVKNQYQMEEMNKQKCQILTELEFMRKYENSCRKQFEKYDLEVDKKLTSLVEQGFSEGSLKNLQKVLEQQLKICLTKAESGFQYASRAAILKVATTLTNKRLPSQSETSLMPSSSKKSLNKSETIEQQSSIEQSDILQYIASIINEVIQDMRNAGNTIQSLKGCRCQQKFISNFKVKNILLPELAKVHEKFQQIKAIYCQKAFQCYQLENSNRQLKQTLQSKIGNEKSIQHIDHKNSQLIQLVKRISELQQKIRDLQATHKSEIELIYLQEQQNQRQLQETIKKIQAKLQQSLGEIQIKDTKIEELTQKYTEKNNKCNEMSQEFRRFRKMMKGLDRSLEQKNKSVNEILQRSLSKSKASASNKTSVDKKKTKLTGIFDTSLSYKSPGKSNKKQDQSIANILYNIIIKYKQLPDSSELATELWSRLNSICQLSGFELSEKLEEYVVNWMKQNNKIGVKETKKLDIGENQRKTPAKQKIYSDLRLRTAKLIKRDNPRE